MSILSDLAIAIVGGLISGVIAGLLVNSYWTRRTERKRLMNEVEVKAWRMLVDDDESVLPSHLGISSLRSHHDSVIFPAIDDMKRLALQDPSIMSEFGNVFEVCFSRRLQWYLDLEIERVKIDTVRLPVDDCIIVDRHHSRSFNKAMASLKLIESRMDHYIEILKKHL